MNIRRRTSIKIRILIMLMVFLTTGAWTVSAQNFGISIGAEFYPVSTITSKLSFPITFLDGKISLLNNLEYQKIIYPFDEWGFTVAGSDNNCFHSVSLNTLILCPITQKMALGVGVNPAFSSDFKESLGRDDLYFSGFAGVQFLIGEQRWLVPIIVYSLGEPYPLPMLMLTWAFTPKLVVSGMIPNALALYYRLHEFLDMGLAAQLQWYSAHGSPEAFGVSNPQLEYQGIEVGPTIQIHPFAWLHLQMEAGYNFLRSFSFSDGKDEIKSIEMENSIYFIIGLVIGS